MKKGTGRFVGGVVKADDLVNVSLKLRSILSTESCDRMR